jgi:hypothetical protein
MQPLPTVRGRAPLRRRLALTALCAASLTAPLAASAQSAPKMRHATYSTQVETLDQRISSLHAALKITPAEETDWTKVADVMRRNEDAMQKMVADRKAQVPHELTAVQDLKTYQKFTEAHADGLTDLIASFETLYTEMPDDQKLVADHVFAHFGHDRPTMHSAKSTRG